MEFCGVFFLMKSWKPDFNGKVMEFSRIISSEHARYSERFCCALLCMYYNLCVVMAVAVRGDHLDFSRKKSFKFYGRIQILNETDE